MNTPVLSPPAFVFVCQAGELEIKALLLAASLRRQLRADHDLIAAVPVPAEQWGELSAATRRMLVRLQVHVRPIENPIGADYPIGNKLACLSTVMGGGAAVFLDSDILCLRDVTHAPAADFAAKPADKRTFPGGVDAWQPLYAANGVSVPQLSIETTVSAEPGPPYFNSGVVFTTAPVRLGAAWIECARTLSSVLTARGQRHWLDQVALPIAVRMCGLDYGCLEDAWNFPAHLQPLPARPPVFCHYHWPHVLRADALLLKQVRELAAEHAELRAIAATHPDWTDLLKS
ncbi:MAG: hypothetical protein ACREPN_02845 [Rudaea sp.]